MIHITSGLKITSLTKWRHLPVTVVSMEFVIINFIWWLILLSMIKSCYCLFGLKRDVTLPYNLHLDRWFPKLVLRPLFSAKTFNWSKRNLFMFKYDSKYHCLLSSDRKGNFMIKIFFKIDLTFHEVILLFTLIQWNSVITNSVVNEHSFITNRFLGQIGHFSAQINPVITNTD